MSPWIRSTLYGFLTCTFVVAVLVVGQGLRRGWDQLSETGYWTDKAIVFAVVAVLYVVFAAFSRRRPESSAAEGAEETRAAPGASPDRRGM
jgi:hypothetical protein